MLIFQPPIVVLNVVVVEASGLEAKDCNGFSDPYCMLGICPAIQGATVAPLTPDEGESKDNESNLNAASSGLSVASNDTPPGLKATIRRG